jgi:N,N'-diacetyllegionaminate synthase
MKCLIIAEAGVNHNGSLLLAKKLIKAASRAGADYVKFQTFIAADLVTPYAKKASYQIINTKENTSQLKMLEGLELKKEWHKKLIEYSKKYHISFFSTAFDIDSLKFLISIGQNIFKIPSGEITNVPLLRLIGRENKKTILSTGMASFAEIVFSIDVLLKSGLKKKNLIVMQCVTEYPAPLNESNLNCLDLFREKLKVNVGFSDHTLGLIAPIVAIAKGAIVIEKHITLNKKLNGPDHIASLDPQEFSDMVQAIRGAEISLGIKSKKPTLSERKNIPIARKSIVASENILKGDFFTCKNITTKRPALGICASKWDFVLGKKAKKNFKKNDFISL